MPFPEALAEILRTAGYMTGDRPVPGLDLEPPAQRDRFRPDAIYRDRSNLEIAFKYSNENPTPERVAAWHRSAWNSGRMPIFG